MTQQTWNATTGFLTNIVAGAGNAVQNLSYQYDKVGNVTTRTDGNQSLTESFAYDSLNRLTSSTVNSSGAGVVTKTYTYDAIGNITNKNDLGAYVYPASGANSVRPHAVSQVTLSAAAGGGKITFGYDANGSLTTQTQTNASNAVVAAKSRTQYYTSFNMPQSMAYGTISAAFYYGPEHQRVKQISSVQGTTIYVNPGNEGALFYEKDIKTNGSIEQRAFINVGGQAIAIVKTTTAGGATTTSTRYLHRDGLGSVTAITNESGAVVERLAYEPFGKRRFANGGNDPNNTIKPVNTDRGFTGHEMLDEIGLIHMNGRVYDPLVGRFLSADPFIQSPHNLQSYNRYTYVMNNPLGYVDPSGYWQLVQILDDFAYSIGSAMESFWGSKIGRAVVAAVVIYYMGVEGGGVFAKAGWGATATAIANGAAAGFMGGMVASDGDPQAGLYGGLTGAAFGWVGTWKLDYGPSIFAHAAVGCASASASGGRCSQGALAAGFAKLATVTMPDAIKANDAYAMTYVSVAGGTASVLGGGKFANGAVTAAFGYVFNELQSVRLRGIGDTYLDDQFYPRVEKWIELAQAQGVDLTFTEAFRTSAYQAGLAGNPNAITPAAAGTSLHEAGFAVDVKYSSLGSIPGGLTGNQQRQIIRDTATQAGINWGGSFSTPDPPHFYVDPGNRAQLIFDAQIRYCQLSGGC